VDSADQVRQLVLEETQSNLRALLTSITREVPRLSGETDSRYEGRRIGGYCYHTQSAATLQELLSYTFYPMTTAMPIIRDLFLGRGAIEEAGMQAELAQNLLNVGLHAEEPDGWFTYQCDGLSLLRVLDGLSESDFEDTGEYRFPEIDRGNSL
jgi:hypothetical protein